MLVEHCTQHRQNPLLHLRYITTNIHVWNNRHKCYILAQSQGILYMHQAPIVVDCCTKYEQNINKITLFFSETTNTQIVWHSGHNYSNLAQSQMLYYKHEHPWYLITVPNMNKIKTFSDIVKQTLNIYEKNCHNYSILAQSKIPIYMHLQPLALDHGTKYEENT